ncbi:MAG: Cd(II)/Pb(II)-responsive transcriptional regulator [Candidatus Adiutrix sp.]|jgi:Cd(II)/Pb(II)-responsive transcriptional regulator|nr:Cd(II)/Pb(II)-responsive transcriptional regulator [Candidatus Adiutrix sp.]
MKNKAMKIGELARTAGCQVVTIRYYEKEGLLRKPERTESGYRLYGPEDMERLKFIRHCRSHGMALDEIKILMRYRDAPDLNCAGVGSLVDNHIADVEKQIESLLRLRDQLTSLRRKCAQAGAAGSCGILKGLADRSFCPCSAAPGIVVE